MHFLSDTRIRIALDGEGNLLKEYRSLAESCERIVMWLNFLSLQGRLSVEVVDVSVETSDDTSLCRLSYLVASKLHPLKPLLCDTARDHSDHTDIDPEVRLVPVEEAASYVRVQIHEAPDVVQSGPVTNIVTMGDSSPVTHGDENDTRTRSS